MNNDSDRPESLSESKSDLELEEVVPHQESKTKDDARRVPTTGSREQLMQDGHTGPAVLVDTSQFVCPVSLGDPVTAIDADLHSSLFVRATAMGEVTVWDVSHVTKRALHPAFKMIREHLPDNERQMMPCLQLCRSSEECIRHVHVMGNAIWAVVGDVQIRRWMDVGMPDCQMLRLERQHNLTVCNHSRVQGHDGTVLVLLTGHDTALLVDLPSNEHHQMQFLLPKYTEPVFMSRKYVLYHESIPNSASRLRVLDIRSHAKSYITLRQNTRYWGFSCSGSTVLILRGNREVCLYRCAPTQIDGNVQHRGDDCFGASKMHSFTAPADISAALITAQGGQVFLLVKGNTILAYDASDDGCTLTHRIEKIKGDFNTDTPVSIHLEDNVLFYSSDTGIYAVDVSDVLLATTSIEDLSILDRDVSQS